MQVNSVLAAVGAAFGVAVALAACSSHSSGSTPSAGTSESPGPTSTVAPGPTPGPVVSAVAGIKAPVTPTQLAAVFGTSLSGPRAATNGQPTLLYGDVTSTTGAHPHLVVSVTIYTPQLLRKRGTTPEAFYGQSEDPTAEHVPGIGQKAYLVQDQITVLTKHNDVLIVAANQQVREDELKQAAKQAAAKL